MCRTSIVYEKILLSCRNLILCTNSLNGVVDNALVNKYAKVCWQDMLSYITYDITFIYLYDTTTLFSNVLNY